MVNLVPQHDFDVISSMRKGPGCPKLNAIRSAHSSMVSARAASTPIPFASFVQLMRGSPRSSMLIGVGPGVVTSGSFTSEAVAFAKGRNVTLINGTELFRMIQMAKAPASRK